MNQFEEYMKTIVYPYIDPRRSEDYFYNKAGKRLRYKVYRADERGKSVLIIHGFSEFLEKYDEVIYHFLRAGLDVYLPEMQGHGYSDRLVDDPYLVHIDSILTYISDIKQFVEAKMPPDPAQRILFGHSMGGGIGARYISLYPKDFRKVILSSPMIKMRTGSVPHALAVEISRLRTCRGKAAECAAGESGFPGEAVPEKMTEKQKFFYRKRLQNPLFQTWNPTYGWLVAAGENEKALSRVKDLPCDLLVFASGRDDLVYPEATSRFARRQRRAKLVRVEGGRHELFNDNDEKAEIFWKEIWEFLVDTMSPARRPMV